MMRELLSIPREPEFGHCSYDGHKWKSRPDPRIVESKPAQAALSKATAMLMNVSMIISVRG
jgi:hypothetical protein